MAASCIFCKIIKGAIPSHKLYETELTYSFLDISPLSTGHAVSPNIFCPAPSCHLVIPKAHAQYLHEVPDESLADLLPVAKKIASAIGAKNYNVLQNNGRLAHQAVDHAHFHIIPKPNDAEGLGLPWQTDTEQRTGSCNAKLTRL
ncbi:hypothetical protein SeMB42_g03944 [Synchytrium endobioticum]|uniref:HIT domain-containing protein n=1 Tax=Synchytrium endobioticum TaxID=286115 RepID=A0A507D2Q9_9FUNG|nr:hypothetical protein SeMB42_g03944 [Synchytrium endobioticum]